MFAERVMTTFEEFYRRLMVNGLLEYKSELVRQGRPADRINGLIVKVIDAPEKKRTGREER